jgi:hypothetical protein
MAAKKKAARRAKRSETRVTAGGEPVREVLYDRVTGRSREVVILPGKDPEGHTPITVDVSHDQLSLLRELSAEIDRNTRCAVPVAGIVRAMLAAVLGARPQLGGCRSEADITAMVDRMMRGSSASARRLAKGDPETSGG